MVCVSGREECRKRLCVLETCVCERGLFMVIHRRSEGGDLFALLQGRKFAAGSSVVACTAREVWTAPSSCKGVGSCPEAVSTTTGIMDAMTM
jgi:hypothetical protein